MHFGSVRALDYVPVPIDLHSQATTNRPIGWFSQDGTYWAIWPIPLLNHLTDGEGDGTNPGVGAGPE